MRTRSSSQRLLFLIPMLVGLCVFLNQLPGVRLFASALSSRAVGATHSGPIAVTPDDRFVWVANPDNNRVTLIQVARDANHVLASIAVGREPQNVAIAPDGKLVYVSNTGSGTVSVIRANPKNLRVVATIRVGTEPYGMAFTPNGDKLYVANARSSTVSVIDGESNRVIKTIDHVGLEPRGVAVTNDGDGSDSDEKVYVTQFLGVDRPNVLIGRDDYKEGRVTVISTRTDRVIGEVVLNPIANSGFKSNGSVLNHVPGTDPPTFAFVTGAFPNQLNSVAIKGKRAYLPNVGASPDGPVRFNVNVQALLSVIDVGRDKEGEAGGQSQTINMNRGINFEPAGATKLFLGVPWSIDFEHRANVGYVVAAASNIVVKVDLDGDGTPTIHAPAAAGDASGIVRIPVGQNPRGIVINTNDTRAYVMNEVSHDVSVIDLTTDHVIATIPTAKLPRAGTDEARILIGKAIFNSSTGVNLPALGPGGVIGQRLSSEGWSACASCHPFGLTDGVLWIFATGPRRTLPLNGSFNPHDPNDAKILNHSAIFDELQDFELNIRNVSGGLGLITLADGTTPDPVVAAFNPPNAGRSAALDEMALFVAHGIRTPIAPSTLKDHSSRTEERGSRDLKEGRQLFESANCVSCHGGGGWSSSRRDFTPPPAASEIVNGQLVRFLRKVGTFDPAAPNELRANGAPALGADGFNPPSLLGAFALGPFFHNGSALTLEQVMENVTHRAAGTGGRDRLADRDDRRALVAFLKSIDASTRPFGRDDDLRDISALESRPAASAVMELSLDVVGPNPSRSGVAFAYSLPRSGMAELVLFDVLGRRVATLATGSKAPGRYQATWDTRRDDGGSARAGVYFALLKTMDGTRMKKVVIE